jgi:two-component system vancomycin resistance sensor histidine kinase VraS
MVQDSQLEMRALLLHLRPLGLKDKSLGEGIKVVGLMVVLTSFL